jgi:predicted metal-dependent enzyme (double-stranded beta helix superfamily)
MDAMLTGDDELTNAVGQFMADAVASCVRLGPTEPAFREIGELLRAIATRPGLFSEERLASLHGSAAASIIARDPSGPVLMLARFSERSPTPVHNHNSWGVLCVARGRDRYTAWRRLDDGSDRARARLAPHEERVLSEGDIAWFGEPPADIHSQQGLGGPAWELVFFGRDPNAQPRAYFDVRTGSVTHAAAER